MPMYLDTTGQTRASVAICGRCSRKMPYSELREDPNFPGLWVCEDDLDVLDPWRLPARETENITLEHPRPDVPLSPGPSLIQINQPQAVLQAGGVQPLSGGGAALAIAPPITQIDPAIPWQPSTTYEIDQTVTPSTPTDANPRYAPSIGSPTWWTFPVAGQDIYQYLCYVPGVSGATPPAWNPAVGSIVEDGTVLWINNGLYLP